GSGAGRPGVSRPARRARPSPRSRRTRHAHRPPTAQRSADLRRPSATIRLRRARFRAVSNAASVPTLYLMSHTERLPRNRTYLICPPDIFAVEYAINPWMDTGVAVNAALARKQWQLLRD